MGGGILVVCQGELGQKYVLGALERRREGKQICTFYGSTDLGETFLQTAIREAEEESLGIFGDRNEILQLIEKNPVKIYNDCYLIDLGVVKRYRRREYIEEFRNRRRNNSLTRCQLEMHEITWIKLENLFHYVRTQRGNKDAKFEFRKGKFYPLRGIFFKIILAYEQILLTAENQMQICS